MFRRFPRYGLPLLLLALIAAAGCGKSTTATAPTPTVQTGAQSSFTAEPQTLQPETLPAASCVSPAFGTRILIAIAGGRDVIIRGFRFQFIDRFGHGVLPGVAPIPGLSPLTMPVSSILASMPIPIPGVAPLPNASPIPIPGGAAINGVLVPGGGSRTFPFFLTFDCGVVTVGTVIVSVDEADANGRTGTTQLRVPVGAR